MTHLFLSPHLDDAILSCGGLINQLTQRGETVLIRTYMAADPPDPLPDTPLITDLHQRWDAGEQPYDLRRQEDERAAGVLEALIEHLNVPDAPYRLAPDGQAIYNINNDLFGAIHPDDPALGIQIDIPPNMTAIYAPLGAGGHVDHQIISQAARRLSQPVFFYEEYPYSANSGEAAHVTYDSGVQKIGLEAVHVALASYDRPLKPYAILLSEADLLAKIGAISCYRSQLSTFWFDEIEMKASVRRYAQEIAADNPAGAERLWVWKE